MCHSKPQKKQDNADNPSDPYAAAVSIAATMSNPLTKLMGHLSQPLLRTPLKEIFALLPARLG
jgi:hypothetical protein